MKQRHVPKAPFAASHLGQQFPVLCALCRRHLQKQESRFVLCWSLPQRKGHVSAQVKHCAEEAKESLSLLWGSHGEAGHF